MAKASPKKSKKSPRLVQRGDVIEAVLSDGAQPTEDVVRSVSVVLNMASGATLSLDPRTDEVTVVVDPPIADDLIAEVEAPSA